MVFLLFAVYLNGEPKPIAILRQIKINESSLHSLQVLPLAKKTPRRTSVSKTAELTLCPVIQTLKPL